MTLKHQKLNERASVWINPWLEKADQQQFSSAKARCLLRIIFPPICILAPEKKWFCRVSLLSIVMETHSELSSPLWFTSLIYWDKSIKIEELWKLMALGQTKKKFIGGRLENDHQEWKEAKTTKPCSALF